MTTSDKLAEALRAILNKPVSIIKQIKVVERVEEALKAYDQEKNQTGGGGSNKSIRENLIKYLRLFLIQNCQYNSGEPKTVANCLISLEPIDDKCEEYNLRHPDHELKRNNEIMEKAFAITDHLDDKESQPPAPSVNQQGDAVKGNKGEGKCFNEIEDGVNKCINQCVYCEEQYANAVKDLNKPHQPVPMTTQMWDDMMTTAAGTPLQPEKEFCTETFEEAFVILLNHAKQCEALHPGIGDAVIEMAEIVFARYLQSQQGREKYETGFSKGIVGEYEVKIESMGRVITKLCKEIDDLKQGREWTDESVAAFLEFVTDNWVNYGNKHEDSEFKWGPPYPHQNTMLSISTAQLMEKYKADKPKQ